MKLFKSILAFMLFMAAVSSYSQSNNGNSQHKQSDSLSFNKTMDSLMNVYKKQNDEYRKNVNQNQNQNKPGNNLFGVTIDLMLGAGFSNTTFNLSRDTAGLSNPSSRTGPMFGANINFRLLGLSFGTGFNYSSKGFTTTSSNSYSANYFNIPLLFTYNINIKKVEIDLTAGPYVGILLSQNNSQLYEMKNIDIGIIGSVQGSYLLNKYLGVLLGVKYEQGGLNNLLKNSAASNYISSIKTTNWFIYSGVKFVL